VSQIALEKVIATAAAFSVLWPFKHFNRLDPYFYHPIGGDPGNPSPVARSEEICRGNF
jgi:hypothetical protein